MRRRLSLWVLVSLVIHAGLVAGALALVGATAPPMLFVDLVHGLFAPGEPAPTDRVGRDDGPPPAGSAGGPARAASRHVAPPRAARMPPSPREATTRAPAAPAPVVPVEPQAEPVRPRPEPVQPAQAMPEPAPAVADLVPPHPPVGAPLSSQSADAAPPSALAGSPPSDGGGLGPATLAQPGDAAGAGARGAGGGPAAGGHGSGAGGGAGAGGGVRDGSVLALAVPGDGGGEGAEYGAYLALVRHRIHERLTYPSSARHRGLSGTAEIEVEIDPTGAIGRVSLAASSSHRVLDDAALEAVRGLRRVPLPPNVRPRTLRVRLPVVFDLR
jgi:periplasmic protein TonB